MTYRTLYPAIEPYECGHLDVGEGHSLYYERVGTQGGKPAVFLHGGPGGGMSPSHRRQWDPARYDVLLFDQRGCGKSLPFAETRANDTWRIVDDIERLREMCGHSAWQVLGGSWGATLALAYAEKYPERTTELILRGVFLARRCEKRWLYEYGASEIMAEQWDCFSGHIPEAERGNLVQAYYDRLTSADEATRLAAATQWSLWEGNVATLLPNPELLADFEDPAKAVPFARICARFFLDDFFLEEAQLLRDVDRSGGHPGRDRAGTPRHLHAPDIGLGAEKGLARSRAVDRARRRPLRGRAGHRRWTGARDRQVR